MLSDGAGPPRGRVGRERAESEDKLQGGLQAMRSHVGGKAGGWRAYVEVLPSISGAKAAPPSSGCKRWPLFSGPRVI